MGIVPQSGLERQQRVHTLEQELNKGVQGRMPWEQRRALRAKILGELVDVFRPGLTGDPPVRACAAP